MVLQADALPSEPQGSPIVSYILLSTLNVNELKASTKRQTGWADENLCMYALPVTMSLYLTPQNVCNSFILLD